MCETNHGGMSHGSMVSPADEITSWEEEMEPRGKTYTGRRQFLCGCCDTLTSVGLGPSFAAASTDLAVVPVESAPFHFEVFENDYVRFLNVLIPPGKVAVYHRHSIDFAYVIVDATDRVEITVLDKPMGLVPLTTGQVVFTGYSKAPLIHQVANAGQGSLLRRSAFTAEIRNVTAITAIGAVLCFFA
jgi:hypothetical protein